MRQTKRQMEADKASAEAEASAARQAADTQHHASVARIAEIEDSVMQEEEGNQVHTNRPDLCPQAGSATGSRKSVGINMTGKGQKKRPNQ
jgi:hypothetical protein